MSESGEEPLGQGRDICWSCQAHTLPEAHFCPECVRIQPLHGQPDFFGYLDLEPHLNIEADELEQRYHDLSRKFHPDYYVDSSEIERKASLQRAAALNRAYRTLKDEWKRAEYAILIATHKKPRQAKRKVRTPPELLEEVFDLNESLEEYQTASDDESRVRIQKFQASLRRRRADLVDRLRQEFVAWDACPAADSVLRESILKRMQDLLDERSYIQTLLDNISDTLS